MNVKALYSLYTQIWIKYSGIPDRKTAVEQILIEIRDHSTAHCHTPKHFAQRKTEATLRGME